MHTVRVPGTLSHNDFSMARCSAHRTIRWTPRADRKESRPAVLQLGTAAPTPGRKWGKDLVDWNSKYKTAPPNTVLPPRISLALQY